MWQRVFSDYFLKQIFNNLITGASNINERINANRKDTTAFPKNDVIYEKKGIEKLMIISKTKKLVATPLKLTTTMCCK